MGSINEHDVMFLREVLVYEPCEHKYGFQEWGKYWEKLQNLWMVWRVSMNYNLKWPNYLYETSISFSQTSLKSVFAQQETETDVAQADIVEHFQEADEMRKRQTNNKNSKNEADTLNTAEMRRPSLETFSEFNPRLGNELMVKKSRYAWSETVQYLREKSENELKLRTEELS